MRDLTKEANNLGDAYETIAVRGINSVNSALSGVIQTALGLHGILGQVIGDFIEMAIRQAEMPLHQGLLVAQMP